MVSTGVSDAIEDKKKELKKNPKLKTHRRSKSIKSLRKLYYTTVLESMRSNRKKKKKKKRLLRLISLYVTLLEVEPSVLV